MNKEKKNMTKKEKYKIIIKNILFFLILDTIMTFCLWFIAFKLNPILFFLYIMLGFFSFFCLISFRFYRSFKSKNANPNYVILVLKIRKYAYFFEFLTLISTLLLMFTVKLLLNVDSIITIIGLIIIGANLGAILWQLYVLVQIKMGKV